VIESRRISWRSETHVTNEKNIGYKILVGKLEKNSPIGRPRQRWEDNIKDVGYISLT
jgi:hypothetical protein